MLLLLVLGLLVAAPASAPCYFLLNYARNTRHRQTVQHQNSLLFSFELCPRVRRGPHYSVWYCVALLFSFELCWAIIAKYTNGILDACWACYFLLNYAKQAAGHRGVEEKKTSCYFLLNYAEHNTRPPDCHCEPDQLAIFF